MRIDAPAKINWALNVLGTRPNGYHLLDMLIQRISVYDTLTLLPHPGILLSVEGGNGLPASEDNLAFKAANALKEYTGHAGGARITLLKRIPVQAGLGGGSADAAAVLQGLNRMWNTGLSQGELQDIGLGLGADVPCCLFPGLTRVGGIGERVLPLPAAKTFHLLILKPEGGLSTGEVFSRFNQNTCGEPADIQQAAEALMTGDFELLALSCRNQLQQAAAAMLPEIRDAIDALLINGAAFARMSGSGSAVFGLFPGEQAARSAMRRLSASWPVCLHARTLG